MKKGIFATWLTEAQQSRQPPSYVTFQSTHSDLLRDEALGRLTWSVRVGVLSSCKLRAGALCFSCLNGRRSRAQIQHCIFCNRRTKAARVHVLSVCDYWEVKRQQTCRQLPACHRGLCSGRYFSTHSRLQAASGSVCFSRSLGSRA